MVKGKNFETLWREWVKSEGYHIERMIDSAGAGRITQARPADFYTFYKPKGKLFYFELKDNQDNAIHIERFTQMTKLLNSSSDFGIDCYFIIRFKYKYVYAIEVNALYAFIIDNFRTKKSINNYDAEKIGTRLKSKKDLRLIIK